MRRPGGSIALFVAASALVPGLGHFLFGLRGRGLAFLGIVAATTAVGFALEPWNLSSATCEYARTYLMIAAIMQILLLFDIFERASGRRP